MFSKAKVLCEKILNRVQLCFLKEMPPEALVAESNQPYDDHQVIIDRLIHAMSVNNHRTSDIDRLEVLCNNIEDFTNLLYEVKDALKGLRDFPKEDLSLRLVKVCNFYRGQHGKFINMAVARGRMLDAMLDVVAEHQRVSAIKNPGGAIAYALLRSTTVMMNIDSLSVRLAEPRKGES